MRGKPYPIRTLAFNLNDPVFLHSRDPRQVEALRPPGTALIDSRSKSQYEVPDSLESSASSEAQNWPIGRSAWSATFRWARISPTTATLS